MKGSYFTQQPSRSARTLPVQQTQPQKPSPPKVISVPVHFVSSDQPKTTSLMLKESSALKIQKTFRGFLVRKSVKKIVLIRNEVIEIERKINNDIEFLNLIRKDVKDRLRVNETLMSLLFKLDSIHGVDFGIRVLRKSVTNKAIALQEKVDSIGQQTLNAPKNTSISGIDNNCNTKQVTENNNDSSIGETDDEIDNEIVKEVDENCVNCVGEMKETGEGLTGELENREVVKKLMDDNEKMMKLMTKISETNEMQTRMINSLSGRVEQLEKAFTIDRMMRLKKKKKTHVCDLQKQGL